MNWRIRNQILIPIMLATAAGISLATYFNIQGLVENENQRVRSKVNDLFETLSATSFPLQTSVLMQVHQISGIHLLARLEQQVTTSFRDQAAEKIMANLKQASESGSIDVKIGGGSYGVYRRQIPSRKLELIAFYPREEFFAATRKVVYPQLISGAVTLILVCFLIIVVARNVTSPIFRLQDHVHRISEGDFSEHKLDRRDEIGDLFLSINQMAAKLQIYEKRIRAQEKLLTLDQMGGGIAHQMRNSITGCRLALDLHRQHCQSDQESLDVAIRQLTFMEDFQKRFLSFAKESVRSQSRLDLAAVVRQYCKLLEPFAAHLHVKFEVKAPETKWIMGNDSMIQQLVGNLVTNAIEAASTNQGDPSVLVTVHDVDHHPALSVRDSGDGVPPKIADQLFDPLVTTKPDGVGLGLAIVKQTVDEHQAKIHWSRDGAFTSFVVVFPANSENQNADES